MSRDTDDGYLRQRKVIFSSLAMLGVGFALAVLIMYRLVNTHQQYRPEARVNLAKGSQTPQTTDHARANGRRLLRIAVAPVVSPEKSLEIYTRLVSYLGRKLGRKPVFIQRQSYSEINDLVRLKRCELAFVCTYAYILGHREFGMRLLAIPRVRGLTTYRSFIIVPAKSPATSLAGLRNQRFASADVMSSSGWLYPMTVIKANGMDPEHFFSQHLISGSHDRSVYAVLSGMVDGAAVDSLVFQRMTLEDPKAMRKLKVIQKSVTFGMPPLVTPADIDPLLAQELLRVLLELHKQPEGKKILGSLKIDRFLVARDAMYDSVRQMVKAWEGKPR